MAGKEEENYLDKLLGSVGVEGLDEEAQKTEKSKEEDSAADEAVLNSAEEETQDYAAEEAAQNYETENVAQSNEADKVMQNHETDNEIQNARAGDDDKDTAEVEEQQSTLTDTVSDTVEDTVPDETAGAHNFDGVPDFSEPELSAEDMERLASMGLDTIIEDVSDDTFSIEDLFGDKEISDNNPDSLTSEAGTVEADTASTVNENAESQMEAKMEAQSSEQTAAAATSEAQSSEQTAAAATSEVQASEQTAAATSEAQSSEQTAAATSEAQSAGQPEGITSEVQAAEQPEAAKSKAQADSKAGQQSKSATQDLENAAVAAAAAAVGGAASQKEAGKSKKKKSGIGQFIRNIFFESNEETPESSKAKKEGKKAGKEAEKDAKEAIKKEVTPSEDGAEELDENQRLIYEMYGNGSDTEEASAPKKGFFAKIKYRIEQMLKKHQEEDKLEQEAEEKEYEEKQKVKAEKKEAGKVKKDEAKKAKVEKQKSKAAKKAEKPKKEKKPKPEPKPGDILKIKPKAIVMFVLFVAGAIILISMLNETVNYNNSLSAAKYNMENGNYGKAYDALSGLKLHKEDKSLYDQASAIMYVKRQYESYENYSSIGLHTEAINALIKGLERYNLYYDKAVELGVNKQVDEVRADIIKKLEEDYKISESEANNLLIMSEENFTQYYSKIEAYGKAKG